MNALVQHDNSINCLNNCQGSFSLKLTQGGFDAASVVAYMINSVAGMIDSVVE
jgi:hypothetical protein